MIKRFLDLLYPSICEICQTSLEGNRSLCQVCADQLPRVREPFCQACGEVFDGNIGEEFSCNNCRGQNHDFLFARAPLKGLATAFHLVHALKYQRRFFLARDLAPFLLEAWEEDKRFRDLGDEAILIPVPLYWRRQQWRQGNQAFELAREFSRISSLKIGSALKRNRSTETQTKLTRRQRLSNLRGAFGVRKKWIPKLSDKPVILIDDVFTTGATAHECARVLLTQGKVSKVAVLTLLRG